MTELHDLLDRRARTIHPLPDALAHVIRRVHRRHRRRQAMAAGAAFLVLAALIAVAEVRPAPPPRHPVVLTQLLGTKQALALRAELGITGPTKGAPESVIVSEQTGVGRVDLSVVQIRTGKSVELPLENHAKETALSPKGDVVAAVSHRGVVVAAPDERSNAALIPQTEGAEGQVSWDGTGSVLFTRVKGQWLRVSNPAGAGGPHGSRLAVRRVMVPAIPGGPILVSVSPGGALAALFGIASAEGGPPVPHLYVGRFDGNAVTEPRRIEIPRSALEGPMGWVGGNAFLLAPEPGRALVVRTDGSTIEVTPEGIEDPCGAVVSAGPCESDGPGLLGTNADGSLLFWKISAEPARDPSAPPIVVLYYKTWLDGTHAVRLSGLVGRLGPPVAPR